MKQEYELEIGLADSSPFKLSFDGYSLFKVIKSAHEKYLNGEDFYVDYTGGFFSFNRTKVLYINVVCNTAKEDDKNGFNIKQD